MCSPCRQWSAVLGLFRWGVGIRVGPLAPWPFPVEGVGGLEGRGGLVCRAAVRWMGGGATRCEPGVAPDAWPSPWGGFNVLKGNSFGISPRSAQVARQVEFGCHAAEIDYLACLNAGELYPDA